MTVDISATHRSKWMGTGYGRREREYNTGREPYRAAAQTPGGHGIPPFAHSQQFAVPMYPGNGSAAMPYCHFMYTNPPYAQFDHRYMQSGYYGAPDATPMNRAPFVPQPQLGRQTMGDVGTARPFVPGAGQALAIKRDENKPDDPSQGTGDMQSKPPAEQVIGEENMPPLSNASKVSLPGQQPASGAASQSQPVEDAASTTKHTVEPEAAAPQMQREKALARASKKGHKAKAAAKYAAQREAGEKPASSANGDTPNQTSEASSAASQVLNKATPVFTEDQIRGRKQAWDRIPMPLDPRRKPSAAANISGVAAAGHDRAQSLPSVPMASVQESRSDTPGKAAAVQGESASRSTSSSASSKKTVGGKGKANKAKQSQSEQAGKKAEVFQK